MFFYIDYETIKIQYVKQKFLQKSDNGSKAVKTKMHCTFIVSSYNMKSYFPIIMPQYL